MGVNRTVYIIRNRRMAFYTEQKQMVLGRAGWKFAKVYILIQNAEQALAYLRKKFEDDTLYIARANLELEEPLGN